MSVKNCEKLEKSRVALTVEVDAATFEAAIEKAYRKVRNQINVPGFRKGKAPRKMIENLYGVGVFYDEAINIAMPEAYAAAADTAEKAAAATAGMRAAAGRAKWLGERAAEYPDGGAVLCSIIARALANS